MAIRPALIGRIYTMGFGVAWCASLGAGTIVLAVKRDGAALVPLVMLIFGGTLCYRVSTLAVLARGDELFVRNYWRNHRVPRADIEELRVGNVANQPFGKQLFLLTRAGTILSLDATGRAALTQRGRERQARRLGELRVWLGQTTPRR